jgi:hypothetical protein
LTGTKVQILVTATQVTCFTSTKVQILTPDEQIDLFVLILALIEMGGGNLLVALGLPASTMKMVRLMKVLRPVRLSRMRT